MGESREYLSELHSFRNNFVTDCSGNSYTNKKLLLNHLLTMDGDDF